MIRFQFYGIQTVFFKGKNSKNVSQICNQYCTFQSQCHIPHQLQICRLLVFHLSKVILSSSWDLQPRYRFPIQAFRCSRVVFSLKKRFLKFRLWTKLLVGQNFSRTKFSIGQNFSRTKVLVGHNFSHLPKIQSLLSDFDLPDKVFQT